MSCHYLCISEDISERDAQLQWYIKYRDKLQCVWRMHEYEEGLGKAKT